MGVYDDSNLEILENPDAQEIKTCTFVLLKISGSFIFGMNGM
jgi:hypothetical protein